MSHAITLCEGGFSLRQAARITGMPFPAFAAVVTVAWWGPPIFVFEVALGLWLLLEGIKAPTVG